MKHFHRRGSNWVRTCFLCEIDRGVRECCTKNFLVLLTAINVWVNLLGNISVPHFAMKTKSIEKLLDDWRIYADNCWWFQLGCCYHPRSVRLYFRVKESCNSHEWTWWPKIRCTALRTSFEDVFDIVWITFYLKVIFSMITVIMHFVLNIVTFCYYLDQGFISVIFWFDQRYWTESD